MYAGIEYRWKKVVENACLLFYVLTKTTMIKTKTEIERENEIRSQLEDVTREIVNLKDAIDELDEVSYNRTFKKKCSELQALEAERNRLINLLNTIE